MMILLIRFFLISLIIYLIVRSFARFGNNDDQLTHKSKPEKESEVKSKGVSKEIGEYIDYEELDK
jgi:large-conductance mechanosensitive channel